MQPLADKLRPNNLEDFIGQEHLVGKNKLINKIIESKKIPNMIIYGPPGTGKTSLVNILSKHCNKSFFKVNGTTTNTDEIKKIINETYNFTGYNGIILYIDEIHFLSKKQQQIVLEFMENGSITLIGSTTENINFSIFNSILSRCILLEFKPINSKTIENKLRNIIDKNFSDYDFSDDSLSLISEISNGDFRRALNILELSLYTFEDTKKINSESINSLYQTQIKINTKNKDNHYNCLSYLQKCIRGSDPDAASLALALLIDSGDIESICRRLLIIASEDIGMAYPQAISIVKSCVDTALFVGLPEAQIPLSQATILLATLPKSNSSYLAIKKSLEDVRSTNIEIPSYLCDTFSNIKVNNSEAYKYPHDFPNNYVNQEYLPNNLKSRKYYEYGNNKFEQSLKEYWKKIR